MNELFTPHNIPGCYIKDHINKWLRRNPAPAAAAAALMYDIAMTSTLASTLTLTSSQCNFTNPWHLPDQ
jgi:hypothetical protein